jgi:CPA1 family monovalent cation:H+ antiporter
VLGAILSPPDAIAATGVTKGLGLPHRTSIVLEGESLVNDASALIAFRFAVAAVAGSAFIPWKAVLLFFIALIGGLLVGWLISRLFTFIVIKRKLDSNVTVSLNMMLPFVAYLVAEEFHVSGVLAAVTVGLMMAMQSTKFSQETNNQSKSAWDTGVFILGGLVFILIGLEFPHVLKNIPSENVLPLIGCAFLIFFVALIIRMSMIFWHKLEIGKRIKGLQKMSKLEPLLDEQSYVLKKEMFRKRRIKGEMLQRELKELKPLSAKDCIIIGWSGMRGIVSLAAALSLPLVMDDGSDFPQRDTIVFLTVVVVIIMLVLQGLGLPILIRALKIDNKTKESNINE